MVEKIMMRESLKQKLKEKDLAMTDSAYDLVEHSQRFQKEFKKLLETFANVQRSFTYPSRNIHGMLAISNLAEMAKAVSTIESGIIILNGMADKYFENVDNSVTYTES